MEFSDHLTFDLIGLGISKVGGDNLLLNFRSASDRPDQLLAKEPPHVPDFHARARGRRSSANRHARCYIKSVALRPEPLHALLLTDLSLSLDADLPGEQPITGHHRALERQNLP
jgi:hypothetical protein